MINTLSCNIARYRKALSLTQEELAKRLGVTFQAVSKWETTAAMPDIILLPKLAYELQVSVDRLLGYTSTVNEESFYEEPYKKADYYWGIEPNKACLKVIELMPPNKRLKLLDIGCGEGKDAVFFARCGYDVTAFDISEAGLEKTKRLAEKANVNVKTFKANVWDYRCDSSYDIFYSSGVLHYIKPELRKEIFENYQHYTNDGGIHYMHVFIHKPFISPPPEHEKYAYAWHSGELFSYYAKWLIENCSEYIFNCNSSGIPHQHAANKLFAKKIVGSSIELGVSMR